MATYEPKSKNRACALFSKQIILNTSIGAKQYVVDVSFKSYKGKPFKSHIKIWSYELELEN